MDYIEYFQPNYTLTEHDPAAVCSLAYDLMSPGASELAPAYEIEVQAERSNPWCASVFGGLNGLSRAVTVANPDALLCVAGGISYFVPVDRPRDYAVLPIRAVRDTLCDATTRRVVMIAYTSVLALGVAIGDSWHVRDLVSDGFSSYHATSGHLVVRGFDAPSDADVEITLDLTTGEVLDRS